MLRLSANISTLFTEWPLLARPAAAAAAGFGAVEIQFPYEVPAQDLAAALGDAGVACVLINIPAGNLEAGELGLAGLPGREREFAAAVDLAIHYATLLDCPRVNCLAGHTPAGAARDPCWQTLVSNVRTAAQHLAEGGLQLLVEPLNPADFPRFLLSRCEEFDALRGAVDHPNLALQYDIYHRRAAGEDWLEGLTKRLPHIGHVQFSDYPGRGAPGSGTLDFTAFFALMKRLPYRGWTGCEYRPGGATTDSLAWRERL